MFDRVVAEYAHKLVRENDGLSNSDSIHVATAILNRVPVLYTYDHKRGTRKGLTFWDGKLGDPDNLGWDKLRIESPPNPDRGTLFEKKDI